MAYSFQMRAVQLDLARQMETLDFVKRFTTFIADNGYNTLVLYLEARVRTDSFPYPAREESYSRQEMAEIVKDATSKGVEVIPVIGALGHAHTFLKYPQLRHLSETRGAFIGRFGAQTHDVFCPSQPGTYEFLRKYLGEIAELFPSSYLHAGCDEAWDMACCDLCRARLAKGESQADLFGAHLRELHRIITDELGKRIIIWDDMFEYYPEALKAIPRDMVMASWHYDGNIQKPKAHFFNRATVDTLAIYDRLGFDYLICPADGTLHNSESLTAYGTGHKPLGGLLTTWEKGDSFMLQAMPLIAGVGRAWERRIPDDFGPVVKEVVEDLFGLRDEPFLRGIEAVCYSGLHRERRKSIEAYLTRRENISHYGRPELVKVLLAVLPEYLEKVKSASKEILEEIILSLRSEAVAQQLQELVAKFFLDNADIAALTARLDEVCGQLEAVGRDRVAMWHRVRPGIVPCKMEPAYRDYLANIRKLPELAARSGVLNVHFMLPDQYSAQQVRILIRYQDSSAWEQVGQGVFKETENFDCVYSRLFLIAADRVPVGVKIETWGFGGQGFTFFEARNKTGRYVPSAVNNLVGNVADAENLLSHDWKWTFAGERDTSKGYYDNALATEIHGFELSLRRAE